MDGGYATPAFIAEESEVPIFCSTSGDDLLEIEEQNALYCFMVTSCCNFLTS